MTVLFLILIPLLVIVSEIKSIITADCKILDDNHKNHHIAILGMIVSLIFLFITMILKLKIPFEDCIFALIALSLIGIYTPIHLRAERKGKELELLSFKSLVKLVIKKIKELVIWE